MEARANGPTPSSARLGEGERSSMGVEVWLWATKPRLETQGCSGAAPSDRVRALGASMTGRGGSGGGGTLALGAAGACGVGVGSLRFTGECSRSRFTGVPGGQETWRVTLGRGSVLTASGTARVGVATGSVTR